MSGPAAMPTVDDWTDDELAQAVAQEHLAQERVSRAASVAHHRQTQAGAELRFAADVAVLILSQVLAVYGGTTRILERGAVLQIPAGRGGRFDSQAETAVLVVGAQHAESVRPPSTGIAGR